ncbi:MAG: ATP-binding protein [Patescibacteria group bacterium]
MPGIKKRILTTFFAIIAILLISEGFFITIDYIILSKYMVLTDNMISEYRLIDNTNSLITYFNKRIKSPLDQTEINQFNAVYSETKNLLLKLDKTITSSKSKIVFSSLKNSINDIIFNVEIGVNDLKNGNYLEAVDRYNEANRKGGFIKENTTNLILKELEYAKNLQVEIDKVRLMSQIIGALLLLITSIGSVWYAIIFSQRFISPIIDLTKIAKDIESGNLNAQINNSVLESSDEVSSLANSFNAMVVSLRNNIKKLQEYNTEIKNSRNYLKSERRKLQQYLDTAGIIVLVFDYNNHILLINKKGQELLGIKNKEAIGLDWIISFVAKKYQLKTKNLLALLIGDPTIIDTLENVIIAKDKSEKNIVWHFSPLSSETNVSQTILATGIDVTELTKAKITINQLKEVDTLKNEVLNIATHELKTPLISIVGLSEVMEKQPKTMPSEYKNFISIIHQEGIKLTGLIKTMLTASRNEIGNQTITKEKFNLADLIMSLQTSLEILVKRTDSKIKFNIQTTKIDIESDKIKISQIIYNFVDNAVKYGPNNQTIDINLFLTDDKFARVEVRGDGKGIPKLMQKKLFMKFSQLEPSLSRSQDGMGLGLYICKQNIESLGGHIGVESEENKGATFYFTIPLT